MRKIIILLIILSIFSCKENGNNTPTCIVYQDSTNYKCNKINDSIVKIVRFYPDTKDTSKISLMNVKKNILNYVKSFSKKGKLLYEVKSIDSIFKKCKYYYNNGNLKKEFVTKNNHFKGKIKYYYPTGEIRIIDEIILWNDTFEYLNTRRKYFKTGILQKDSSFYVNLNSEKDTISINDSLKVNIQIIKPNTSMWRAYIGSFEIENDIDYENINFISKKVFYFKPQHIGTNFINIVTEIKYKDRKSEPYYTKIFKSKEFFVTK